MKENLFEGRILPAKERIDNLRSLSVSEEPMTFQKPLSEEELQYEKDKLSQAMIKLKSEQDALDKVKQEAKGRMKPLENERNESLTRIKNKSIEVTGTVFLVDDQEIGMMGYYDESGSLISSRRLLPSEKQTSIFSNSNYKVSVIDKSEFDAPRKDGSNG